MFGIGLQVFQCDPEFAGVVRQIGDDLIERLAAVDARFPLAQQVQVRPVEQENSVFCDILSTSSMIMLLSVSHLVDYQKSSHFLRKSVCTGTQISQLY